MIDSKLVINIFKVKFPSRFFLISFCQHRKYRERLHFTLFLKNNYTYHFNISFKLFTLFLYLFCSRCLVLFLLMWSIIILLNFHRLLILLYHFLKFKVRIQSLQQKFILLTVLGSTFIQFIQTFLYPIRVHLYLGTATHFEGSEVRIQKVVIG